MAEKHLSIVLPVYNEGENIREALIRLLAKVKTPCEILIVYDFEEDTTLPALASFLGENMVEEGKIKKVRNTYGRGVLYAIKTGLEKAQSKYVVVTMADLCDPPEVIDEMVKKAEEEDCVLVCGSRYMKGGSQKGGPIFKGFLSRCAGLSLHFLAGIPVHDVTNSFKLYRKSFLAGNKIESTGGFELGLELTVKAFLQGEKIGEVPTSWEDRVAGKSNFKLAKWLPKYLKWYFTAFTGKRKK